MTARNRGRSNGNEAGNSAQRRRRKQKLIDRDGDGVKAPCWECGALVTTSTIFVDRITPGVDGGTYNLDNCRVHCRSCSGRQGQRMKTAQATRLKMFQDEQTRGRGVRFKTEVLRAAVESAITQSEIEHNKFNDAQREAYAAKAQAHAEEHNSAWEKALPKIRAAIRANRPITMDIIPGRVGGWRGEAQVFTDKPPKDSEFVVPADLRVMRNALRLVIDDEVTTTALRQLGVSATMIRTVCELAREETAKEQAKEKIVAPAKSKTTRKRTATMKPITIYTSVNTIPQEEPVP